MTAYFFVMRRDRISVYQDTLVTDLGDPARPAMGHVTKILSVHDLNLVICGSGSLFFQELARDTILLNGIETFEEAAAAISHFVDRYQRRTPHGTDVHIYLLGVDLDTGMSEGYSILTGNGHEPRKLSPALCCNNVRFKMRQDEGSSILPSHDEIMDHLGGLPANFRREAGIGGAITFASITRNGIDLRTVGAFADESTDGVAR